MASAVCDKSYISEVLMKFGFCIGGDANKIPYLYDGEQLCEGLTAVLERLQTLA